MKDLLKKLWKEEEGLGTLEILLIVAVLVGVALLFREKITSFVTTLLNKTETNINSF